MRSSGLILCSLLLASSAWAYTPPIGIPDPAASWGGTQDPIDDAPPARPDPWDDETAGYYYVNRATGTDTGRTYGTPAAPRATIPSTIPAGSYVEVHGAYAVSSGGSNRINGSGTSAAWSANSAGPVWVVGLDADKPTFGTYKIMITGTYIYLYNVLVTQPASGNAVQVGSTTAGYGADHVAIRQVSVTGSASPGNSSLFSVSGSSINPVSYVVVQGSTGHDAGPSYDVDMDAGAFSNTSNTSYVWVLGNTFYNTSGSGVQVTPGLPASQYVYVGANTIYNTRQAGIWVKYGTDVIVSENVVHDVQDRCVGSDTSPSKGLGGQYRPDRVWWINNHVYNVRYGIRLASTDSGHGEVYAIGNLIHDVKDMGGSCFTGPDGTDSWLDAAIHYQGGDVDKKWAVNNTIYSAVSGIHDSHATVPARLYNNIVNTITDANGYALFTATTGTDADYNLFSAPTGNLVRWATTSYATKAAWTTATEKGANTFEADPLFVSTATLNLSLQTSSTAKGAALAAASLPTDVYALFASTYSLSIATDRAGTARPQETTWDMGAYEFVATEGDVTAPVISAPLPSAVQSCDATTSAVTLAITTDENATCKYGTVDLSYDSLPSTFEATGATAHTQSVTLACDATHTYYTRCADTGSNKNATATVIAFAVAARGATLGTGGAMTLGTGGTVTLQ